MKMYRHLNLLVDGKLYDSLRKYSRKQEIPVSEVVREAIARFLGLREEVKTGDSSNEKV